MTNKNTARKSLLNGLMGAGRIGFRKGKTLAAIKADLIARGKVAADDIIALGHVNEGFQTERMETDGE